MNAKTFLGRSLLVIAAALSLAATTRNAGACFNVTRAEVDGATKKVKSAQAALDGEDLATAHKLASEALVFFNNATRGLHEDGKLRSPDNKPIDPPDASLVHRAHRIDALAISRGAKSTAEEREDAVKRFEGELLGGPSDPALAADYAELLSRVPARAGQAKMMLRALRDKDLIGSARAFLALAQLEKADGNADAEKVARDRCRTSAVKKAICDA